jgi:hypothetical protein
VVLVERSLAVTLGFVERLLQLREACMLHLRKWCGLPGIDVLSVDLGNKTSRR